MKIEKELRVFLHSNNLTPNQGFFLISLYNNDDKYINNITKKEKEELYERNLIFNFSKPALRSEGLSLFEDDNMKSLFDEFWDKYPFKTPNQRVLKTNAKNTKIYNDSWVAYSRYIKKKSQHLELMKGLAAELHNKKTTNSENYQKEVRAWLRSREWEKFADSEVSEIDNANSFVVS